MMNLLMRLHIKKELLKSKSGMLSIEMVGLIALVVLGIFVAYDPLKDIIVSVFDEVGGRLQENLQ